MFSKCGCESSQGSARASIRQSGVQNDLGRRKHRQSKPFSYLDNPNRSDTLRQRRDSETGRDRGSDSRSSAAHENLDPSFTGGIEGAGGDISDTA